MAAELTVTDGRALPDDLPRGELTVRLADGRIWIDHADPRILVSAELLDLIADHPTPGAWLDTAGCVTYDGALLKIHAANRNVVYRITEYLPRVRGFIGVGPEWPAGAVNPRCRPAGRWRPALEPQPTGPDTSLWITG